MSKYSLTYFDIQGRAEPIRIALAYAGNDFEDKRISFEEWGKMKADTPQGSLPVCSIDGEVFWQSTAILRNIAREFDLYGKTNKEMTTVDIVISNFEEFFDKSAQVFMQHDPEKKEELSKEFGEKVVQPVKLFNKLLTENKNGGWLVGPQGSSKFVSLCQSLEKDLKDMFGEEVAKAYLDDKTLVAHIAKIEAEPAIKKWVEKRPKAIF